MASAETFSERVFGSILGYIEVATIYMGERLGLYRTLIENGAMTSAELAAATGTDERQIREWLEQQAVSDILTVDDVEAEASERRYTLPSSHAEVLLDANSLAYLAPVARFLLSTTSVMPELLESVRTGAGVPWESYGVDAMEGQAGQNRPLFLSVLAEEWIGEIPDIHEKLVEGARVLDVGCGGGWASIGLAAAYPNVEVTGIDPDAAAIEMAKRNAEEHGVEGRVRFIAGDAAALDSEERFELATMLEMVHDLAHPVPVLRSVRAHLTDGGSVFVMDEQVAETFTAPGDELERLFYGFSVLNCLPSALSEDGAVGTGTVMRPETLRGYAEEAGFTSFEILPIEHDFFRLYRLS